MNRPEQEYYLGLDCGTNSVGWAVTDTRYNLKRFKGKDMWGVHLFDEGAGASNRKYYRNCRRLLDRCRERVLYLQDIFDEAIEKIDSVFFLRLNESYLHVEDRDSRNQQHFSLFNDEGFTDIEYNEMFPTMYHLRLALIDGTAPEDPRLVYLALQHILKNRGHFLFPGKDLNASMSLHAIMEAFDDAYYENFDEELNYTMSCDEIEVLLQDTTRTTKEKIEILSSAIYTGETSGIKDALVKMMFGYKVKINKIFHDVDIDLTDIHFQASSFETADLPLLEDALDPEAFKLIEVLKQIFDWTLLCNIMRGTDRGLISEAKVAQYETNRSDIKTLKRLIRKYKPEEYKNFFYGSDAKSGLFSNYIGSVNSSPKTSFKGKKVVSRTVTKTTPELFYRKVNSLLSSMPADDADVIILKAKIESDDFFPLLRSYRNGVVPYQVNKTEMEAILSRASSYLPWLNVRDEEGLSPTEKILMLLEFRVPYYVGPMSYPKYNSNAWIIRKKEGKIHPWNFSDMVDEIACDERFIRRRTNKCTYLVGEDVLPVGSLLYQKFKVLESINTLRINDVPITVEQKQTMYRELFLDTMKNITPKVLEDYIRSKGWIGRDEELFVTGVRKNIEAKLSSYHLFKNFDLKRSEKEWIINALTIHADGGKLIERKIRSAFGGRLSDNEIRRICRMRFSGWGRLSEKFLTGLMSDEDKNGESYSIISLMWLTNQNLMQILCNKKYGFMYKVQNHEPVASLNCSIFDGSRLPPTVKRQVWQALKVVKEIEQIMGHAPKKIFVEVARYLKPLKNGKKPRTKKEKLLSLFNDDDSLKKKYADIYASLQKADDNLSGSKNRLYLYYSQLGRCMYSGEPIDLDDLMSGYGKYDIDHIYPYSKSADDSISNRVLVKTTLNRAKDNRYPIDERVRKKMIPFWKLLFTKGFISETKFYRLTRSSPLTEDDFKGFINRQISDTRYSSKELAHILEAYFGPETKVIFSKSCNVTDFRNTFGIYKARSINDLHHAKDAYLNIVVGNVLYEKFTSKWFLTHVSFNDPFKYKVDDVWTPDETIELVRKTCFKNSILFTRQPERRTGQLFNVIPVPKGSNNDLLPKKLSDPKLQKLLEGAEDKAAVIKAWTDRYGGYNSKNNSHFALIRVSSGKNGKAYVFVPICMIRASELADSEALYRYCTVELGYSDVEVVRPVVMFNTMLCINGSRYTLTGYTSGRIIVDSATPLLLSNEETAYVRRLESFSAYHKKNTNAVVFSNSPITAERNIELYLTLQKKAHSSCYERRPASQIDVIGNGLEIFKTLPVETQVDALLELIAYFSMTNGVTDLKAIGGKGHSGILKMSAKISNLYDSFSIIDSSVTGFFERKLVLK